MTRKKITLTAQPLDDLILRATIRDEKLAEAVTAVRRFLKDARRIARQVSKK